MKMLVVALVFGLISCTHYTYAQQGDKTNEPHTVVTFFSAKGEKLPSMEGASKYFKTVYQDSVRGVKRGYYANGSPFSYTEYENVRRDIRDGKEEHWYENGQLHSREHWSNGNRNGELTTYYKTGTLKRRETYVDNKSTGGECFDQTGKAVAFYDYEIMPVPPGGMAGFMEYITKEIQYPTEALRKNIQGKVFVNFAIDTTGQIFDVKIAKGVHPVIDEEALRVVKAAPAWIPALQDGLHTAIVRFTVPITFYFTGKRKEKVKPNRQK